MDAGTARGSLAGVGAVVGLPIADLGVRVLVAVSPPDFPRLQEIGIDTRVLGMTMLIATHEMSFAREIASRVCFLDQGVVLEQGPPAEILSAPREPRTQQFLERVIRAHRL